MGNKVTSYKVLFRFSVSEKKPLSELMYWVGVVGDNILPNSPGIPVGTAEAFGHGALPTLSYFILVHDTSCILGCRSRSPRAVSTFEITPTVGNKQP
jgi:hypothetical protein